MSWNLELAMSVQLLFPRFIDAMGVTFLAVRNSGVCSWRYDLNLIFWYPFGIVIPLPLSIVTGYSSEPVGFLLLNVQGKDDKVG